MAENADIFTTYEIVTVRMITILQLSFHKITLIFCLAKQNHGQVRNPGFKFKRSTVEKAGYRKTRSYTHLRYDYYSYGIELLKVPWNWKYRIGDFF